MEQVLIATIKNLEEYRSWSFLKQIDLARPFRNIHGYKEQNFDSQILTYKFYFFLAS